MQAYELWYTNLQMLSIKIIDFAQYLIKIINKNTKIVIKCNIKYIDEMTTTALQKSRQNINSC